MKVTQCEVNIRLTTTNTIPTTTLPLKSIKLVKLFPLKLRIRKTYRNNFRVKRLIDQRYVESNNNDGISNTILPGQCKLQK